MPGLDARTTGRRCRASHRLSTRHSPCLHMSPQPPHSQISAPEHPHRRQRSRPCICASPATEQVPFTKCMRATLAAIVHAVDGGAPCTAPIAYYLSAGPCEHRWTHGLSTIGGRCSPEATGIPSSGEGPTAAPHHHRIVSNKAALCARRRPHVSLIRSSPRRRYAR